MTRLLCWKASNRPLRTARGSTTTMVASITLDRSRSHAIKMEEMEDITMDITTMVGMGMGTMEDTTITVGMVTTIMATTTTMVTGMEMAMEGTMAMGEAMEAMETTVRMDRHQRT